jgi:hypothetical protein
MTYLIGLVVAFLLFGGLELIWRSIGVPLSVFGAIGAVLRQTDEPRLQRRQALTMLLLSIGSGMAIVGAVLLAQATFTRTVFSLLGGGVFLLTLAGHLGGRTLRAIARSQQQASARNVANDAKSR